MSQGETLTHCINVVAAIFSMLGILNYRFSSAKRTFKMTAGKGLAILLVLVGLGFNSYKAYVDEGRQGEFDVKLGRCVKLCDDVRQDIERCSVDKDALAVHLKGIKESLIVLAGKIEKGQVKDVSHAVKSVAQGVKIEDLMLNDKNASGGRQPRFTVPGPVPEPREKQKPYRFDF